MVWVHQLWLEVLSVLHTGVEIGLNSNLVTCDPATVFAIRPGAAATEGTVGRADEPPSRPTIGRA
jgi:hypothetical protein